MRQRYFDPHLTAAIYENPANSWREPVPKRAWLWMLLFGAFYLAARSLWIPLGIVLAILLGTMLVFWPFLLIVVPLVYVTIAFKAQDIFRSNYMRKGWIEIDPWDQDGTVA